MNSANNMKFDKKLNTEEKNKYLIICEIIWGCYPIDVEWAINTNIYKNMESILISSGNLK